MLLAEHRSQHREEATRACAAASKQVGSSSRGLDKIFPAEVSLANFAEGRRLTQTALPICRW